MPPFESPTVVLNGFKERAESLLVQDATLAETKKAFTRRAIDQLGFVKDINSLVVLSESQLTLYPLPLFTPATPLPKTKTAFSFATYSGVQYVLPNGREHLPSDGEFDQAKAVPTQFTQLAVGCRRKMIIYSWRDGEAQEVRESVLPHSPRVMSFFDHSTICLAYAPEYAVFSVTTMTAVDVSMPTQAAATTSVGGAFSGLSGYMTLGLGSKPKPTALRLSDKETVIAKENQAFTIDATGKLTKPESFDWPAPPEDTAFVKPYIFSVLPSGTVPLDDTKNASGVSVLPSFIPTSVVQIRSSLSSLPVQTLPYPFTTPPIPSNAIASGSATVPNSTIRLLTSSPSDKSPLFLITTPTDRTQATAEGSTIWQFSMKPWAQQIDELVRDGFYADALALLDTLDKTVLPDKDQRNIRIRALNAVSQFRAGKWEEAMKTFIALDFNPAKVVALYPDSVAGRLSVPSEKWISLYGGPAAESDSDKEKEDTDSDDGRDQSRERTKPTERSPSPTGSIIDFRGRLKTGFNALLPAAVAAKDEDTRSISSVKRKPKAQNDTYRSVQTLVKEYLTELRPKIGHALEVVHIKPSQAHQFPFLSETSTEDLFSLPNLPLSSLTPEQLLRFAQIVDTALFKAYLLVLPGLLGSLCRLPNFCEVSEVEQELLARKKYAELIDLYNGRKMHDKALGLLRKLSEEDTDPDPEEKLRPSVSYLQKLGPDYLQQIFDFSRWVFEQNRDIAFEIFTSEDVQLPKESVADYLEQIDPAICARYLVFLMDERDEVSPLLHDRLAGLYLTMTLSARKCGDNGWKDTYEKLLQFITTTHYYDVDRLYGLLTSEDLYEARAILLGRLGRHEQALETYAYRMGDYLKAEEYCKSIYAPASPTASIFLALLRIYLRPAPAAHAPNVNLLQPALDLISRHSPRLDPVETLQLLPPLVTTRDVRAFLFEALRTPTFDTAVVREVNRARNDQVARRLMGLEARRVKVTDSRICPQCHKRIGTSVIAVHNPRGEVTHYQCREAFSKRINETRRH
ncbi:hypothetical protein HWV62_2139 [Athelia sp. TMB]|nr:hypothetical protein HWV62_2139 [Athelia sp. TMB]